MHKKDEIIFETEHCYLKAPKKPHVDRFDGGHLVVSPKKRFLDRQSMLREVLFDCVELSVHAGRALKETLAKSGIELGRINYQDNGNWSLFSKVGPSFHLHIYGRAKDAKIQKFGQALYFPHPKDEPEFYKLNESLKDGEILSVKNILLKIYND